MSSLLTTDPPTAPSLSPAPSPAEKHNGLLGDYDALLSLIRNAPPEKLADTLIKPKRCSPMYLEDETGQRSLQALAQNADYRALCKTVGASPYGLTVTLKDGKNIYETRARDSEVSTPIPLGKNPVWNGWLSNIEKAARKLGGQIRQNGEVTFARMAWFYGIALPDPLDGKQCEAAIQTLEEKRARHSLGQGDAIRLDELGHGADAGNRSVDDLIMETMRERLPQLRTSLLTYLSPIDIARLTIQDLRAKPTFYLEKILLSEEADALTEALLRALKWYGGNQGEDSAPSARIALLVKAITLWLSAGRDEQGGAIAGYHWQAPSNWGKSYEAIWLAFESHLLASKRASSVNESILLACLYRPSFPLDFQIPDIPSELPYRSSTVWVNFVHGVQLANAIDPTLLQRSSFQRLVDLPGVYIGEGNAEDFKLVSFTRLKPALAWAVTNGLVTERTDADYSLQDIEKALQTLDQTIGQFNSAAADLSKAPPDRLTRATDELKKLFGHSLFLTGAWKLKKESNAFLTSTKWEAAPADNAFSLVDVYASGWLHKTKWYVTDPFALSVWFALSKDGILATNYIGPRLARHKGKKLPNIENTFNNDFNAHIKGISSAYRTLIIQLLASLPLADRQALEYGTTQLYSLRQPTNGIEAANETEKNTLPFRARGGFILQTTWKDVVSHYEVLPRAGFIHRRTDIKPEHFGGEKKTETFRARSGSGVKVTVLRNKHLPFDWNAHAKGTVPRPNVQCDAILDQIGDTLHGSPSNDVDQPFPRSLQSQPIQTIANQISDKLLYIDEAGLRRACYGETEFDRRAAESDRVDNIFKSFVPFWSSIEDLNSGDRDRLVAGAFGLFTDLTAFILPLGKFASGSLKIARKADGLTFTQKLPLFLQDAALFLNSTLNPIEGIPSLLKSAGLSLFRLGKKGYLNLKTLSGRAGQYDLLQGLPQSTDPGRWRPLSREDQLATIYGIEDVPVRNIANQGKPDFRLVDPMSTKPYGPALTAERSGLSFGPSRYDLLGRTDTDSFFMVPDNTRVREVLEVDGSRTFYLDDVPYRLEDGALRRLDTLDATKNFRKLPCR